MPALVKSSVGSDNGTTWEEGTAGRTIFKSVMSIEDGGVVVEIAELAG